jgi:hypothetical protein
LAVDLKAVKALVFRGSIEHSDLLETISASGKKAAKKPFHGPNPYHTVVINDHGSRARTTLPCQVEISLEATV